MMHMEGFLEGKEDGTNALNLYSGKVVSTLPLLLSNLQIKKKETQLSWKLKCISAKQKKIHILDFQVFHTYKSRLYGHCKANFKGP